MSHTLACDEKGLETISSRRNLKQTKPFDVVMSLGVECQARYNISRTLWFRRHQTFDGFYLANNCSAGGDWGTFLFDWSYSPTLNGLIKLLQHDLSGSFSEGVHLQSRPDGSQTVVDLFSGFQYPHQFSGTPEGTATVDSVNTELPLTKEKFAYLAEKTRRVLDGSGHVLFIRCGNASDNELSELLSILKKRVSSFLLLYVPWTNTGSNITNELQDECLLIRPCHFEKYPGDAEAWRNIFEGLEFTLPDTPEVKRLNTSASNLAERKDELREIAMPVMKKNNDVYTQDFYLHHRPGMESAAGVIAPIIRKLVPVQHIVDVGCGQGAWLAEFRRLGVEKILGIDGDHVQQDSLLIPKELFLTADLSDPDKLLDTDFGLFDLSICLEVAEHLPASCAEAFVKFLTGLAPVVLFSAAVPGQGGTHHVNEQFLSYWVNLFSQFDYRPLDIIRPIVWNDDRVPFWYRQNIILFANDSDGTWSELLRKVTTDNYMEQLFSSPIDAIHPELFKKIIFQKQTYLQSQVHLKHDTDNCEVSIEMLPLQNAGHLEHFSGSVGSNELNIKNMNIEIEPIIENILQPPTSDSNDASSKQHLISSWGRFKTVPDYIQTALLSFLDEIDFTGLRVLEIGGSSLPSELVIDTLKARQWVSVDLLDHGSGRYQFSKHREHYERIGVQLLNEASIIPTNQYAIFDGSAENIPASFQNYFDVVVSINAFEHITHLDKVLEQIFLCLKPHGKLLSIFGPIWSSLQGSHFWINDEFNFNKQGILPNWAHLLMSPKEISSYLAQAGIDQLVIDNVLYQFFDYDFINRFFFEDYVALMRISPFSEFSIAPIGSRPVPVDVKKKLEANYPEKTEFSAYGISIVAKKCQLQRGKSHYEINIKMLPLENTAHLENFADSFGSNGFDLKNRQLRLKFQFVSLFKDAAIQRFWLTDTGVTSQIQLTPKVVESPYVGQKHSDIAWSARSRFIVDETLLIPDTFAKVSALDLLAEVGGEHRKIGVIHISLLLDLE